jgi:hypothetical protein
MPAQAGIQKFKNNKNLNSLDSRFRGKEAVSPNCGTASMGKEEDRSLNA